MPFKPKTAAGQIRWPLMAYLLTVNIPGIARLPVSKGERQMPQPRKLEETTLLALDAAGLTAVAMQRHLADEGISVSLDLIRKRLSEARRAARGDPPAPRPQRKSSATTRRQGQLAEAVNLVAALRDDLQGVLDGWAGSFAGSERYERFQAAVESLESAAEALESVDVSWG